MANRSARVVDLKNYRDQKRPQTEPARERIDWFCVGAWIVLLATSVAVWGAVLYVAGDVVGLL